LYLIDSDWLIDHLNESPEATQLLSSLASDGIAISAVTYMEAFHGTLRSPNSNAAAKLDQFISQAPVLPFDAEVAEECARLRQHLVSQGKRPVRRSLDMLIAATAITYELILVTRNLDDYVDLPRIRLFHSRSQST
jgi:tRNA(fMet)-specific endonuclease VapC